LRRFVAGKKANWRLICLSRSPEGEQAEQAEQEEEEEEEEEEKEQIVEFDRSGCESAEKRMQSKLRFR
jgi:hypothetical protein